MKVLVVYYSRTDTTRKVAKALANRLACDVEEVVDTVDRHGLRGRLRAGRDATMNRLTTIQDVLYDPSQYDLVIDTGTFAIAGAVELVSRALQLRGFTESA